MTEKRCLLLICTLAAFRYAGAQSNSDKPYHEPYRPQVHFSPKEHWMNDPNGMIFYKGNYHLFFQYYPNDIVWGPMHWGHAVSKDMFHWKQLPIALYPDSLGYIFSGSAVVDYKNTSGFGKNDHIPIVAIFTHHDPKAEKAGSNKTQSQSIAYSLDDGNTWTKYGGNPVLKNPGIIDFRDPHVRWYAPANKWLMTLATKDRITFYSSRDLKGWTKESEFGQTIGAHGGVWECPDLFQLKLNGKNYWVLLVSINPGGPNGGSATQYFIGDFDGKTFTPLTTDTRWVDYGPDDYAGVTWGNTGERKIFLGWMSNWLYATKVPTEKWRSAMTVPRELSLKQLDGNIYLISNPVKEMAGIFQKTDGLGHQTISGTGDINLQKGLPGQFMLNFSSANIGDYTIILSNKTGEQMSIGYQSTGNTYFIDRSKSGEINFYPAFGKPLYAPRLTKSAATDLKLVADASSVELFADGGLITMTAVFFSKQGFDRLQIKKPNGMPIKNLALTPLKSIWKAK